MFEIRGGFFILLFRLGTSDGSDQLDSLFTLIRFWPNKDSLLIRNRINQWFANEWITIHLPFIFDSVWFWFAGDTWFAGESWLARNQNQTESKSKWINTLNRKSESSCDFNRFGPSPDSEIVRFLLHKFKIWFLTNKKVSLWAHKTFWTTSYVRD